MNNTFKLLYGIEASAVQKTCVIMPFDIPKAAAQLGVAFMTKGKCFSCGQGQGLTLIRSGMSAGFVGDSILWLDQTPCEHIFFLGTCGLIQEKPGLDIGTVLTPKKIYPFESFSDILRDKLNIPEPVEADTRLIYSLDLKIPSCNCVSFSSLHEEEKHMAMFLKLGVDVIEMECSAFFLAAQKIKRKASALLVISDIVGDKNICFNLSPKNKTSLANGISQASKIIKKSCASAN